MRSVNSAFTSYGKRPLAPSNDPNLASSQPPLKRRRTHLSADNGKALTATQQRTRDAILQRLHTDPTFLDLSDFTTTELMSLPASAICEASARVTHVKLPMVLSYVPPICSQMPALTHLHLLHFFGTSLNLLGLPQLKRVEGSASVQLAEIHVDAATDLDIDIGSRLCKVRVHRYLGNQLSFKHALPGHAYTHMAPGASRPDYTQLNGVTHFADNGQTIYCRHICRHVMDVWPAMKAAGTSGEPGLAGIASVADLSAKVGSDTDQRYRQDILYSKAYAFIDESGFGAFAADQLALLMRQAETDGVTKKSFASYYLASVNHVTALFLTAKATVPPVFKATLVDPNYCLARSRIEANSLEAIRSATRGWRLSQLIQPQMLAGYTNPGMPALMYAFSPLHRGADEKQSVGLYMKNFQVTNSDLIFATAQLGLHELLKAALDKLLSAYEQDGISGAQLQVILQARIQTGYTALDTALCYGQVDCVHHFISAIERLTRVKTLTHLLNLGQGKLPDDWCESLLRPRVSWHNLTFLARPDCSASLSALIHAYQRMFESGALSAAACVKQIERGSEAGTEGSNVIDAAMAVKDDAILSALQKLVTALHKSGAINREQCAQLVKDAALLETWLPASAPPDVTRPLFPVHPITGEFLSPEEADRLRFDFDFQADSDFSIKS